MKPAIRLYLLGILILLLCAVLANGCASAAKVDTAPKKLSSIIRLIDKERNRFFCSGVVISDTLAFTAAHCVVDRPTDVSTILVQSNKDSTVNIEATLYAADPRSDMAIIKGDFRVFNQRGYETKAPQIEEAFLNNSKIVACGFPYGGNLVCTPVTEVHRCLFQFCAQGFLFPGMSGGPVIDLRTGVVVGVNTAVTEGGEIVLSPIVNIFDALHVSPNPQ